MWPAAALAAVLAAQGAVVAEEHADLVLRNTAVYTVSQRVNGPDATVDGIELALTRDEAIGEAFNIGNPRSTVTIYQLARLITRLAESKSEIRFVEWDFPDVELRIPDVKKAERLLGFRAQVDLEDGIARTLAWYRSRARHP